MPTPAVHLHIAQEILRGAPAGALDGHAGDYLLGSVAPDAWSVGDITRRQSHLLPIPIPPGKQGAQELLAQYPALRDSRALAPAQAAFVAGYMAHLLVDEVWYYRVFDPYFSQGYPNDPPLQRRLLWHNALRLHCENSAQDDVAEALIDALAGCPTRYDFPLFTDSALQCWRDRISAEMRPGACRRSAEVFAERLHIPVEELLLLVQDPVILKTEVLDRLPAGLLAQVQTISIEQGGQLTRRYLAGETGAP